MVWESIQAETQAGAYGNAYVEVLDFFAEKGILHFSAVMLYQLRFVKTESIF
jgi:hypothetical protein